MPGPGRGKRPGGGVAPLIDDFVWQPLRRSLWVLAFGWRPGSQGIIHDPTPACPGQALSGQGSWEQLRPSPSRVVLALRSPARCPCRLPRSRTGWRRAGSLRGPAGPALAARTGPPSRLDRRAGGRPLPLTKKRPLPLTTKPSGLRRQGLAGAGPHGLQLPAVVRAPRPSRRSAPARRCLPGSRAGWWWGGPARAPRGRRLGPNPNGTARSSRTSSAPIRLGNSAPFPTSPWPGFYATCLPAELCV